MAEITRRDFLKLALVGAAAPSLLAACAREAEKGVVNFFNWSKYIGSDTLPRFTRRTGIKVNYEEFADEEEMFAKLKSGARGYDLMIGTDYMIPRLKALDLLDPYPPGAIKNLGNVDAKFRNPPYDPGNALTLPYLWGTTGIAYNKEKVRKAPTSWWDLWDERYKGRISILDNVRACVATALLMKGYPQTTKDPKAYQEVRELFLKQKPLVKQYSSATYIDSLVAGEVHIAMAWSGDVLQAARENPRLDYVIPKEGSFMWVDNLCLVKGSPHREEAVRLADYLLEGPVAAETANTVRYASPNAAARAGLDKALLKDPRVYPPPALAARIRFYDPLDSETTQLWNEAWSDVKST